MALSLTTATTWQTATNLSTIERFNRFYETEDNAPIKLYDGSVRIEEYRQVPFNQRLAYKDVPNTFVYDEAIAGDSISNNVFTLFSGFDDDESPIDNFWQDGQLNLGTDNLKISHFMRVTGLIQKDQDIAVYLILDDGTPVQVFTIEGDGSYVDQGINTPIGSETIGSKVIGGGGEATAHPFDITFPIHTDRYQYISAKFQALEIGHAAINSYGYKDNRDKGRRSLPTKTV